MVIGGPAYSQLQALSWLESGKQLRCVDSGATPKGNPYFPRSIAGTAVGVLMMEMPKLVGEAVADGLEHVVN